MRHAPAALRKRSRCEDPEMSGHCLVSPGAPILIFRNDDGKHWRDRTCLAGIDHMWYCS